MNSEVERLAKMLADAHESIGALRNELAAARAERERAVQLEAAVDAFLRLPNWENRVGPWKSENEALRHIAVVRARGKSKEGLTP